MAYSVPKCIPLPLHCAVEKQEAGRRFDGIFVDEVDPPRPTDPTQRGIEDQQCHQTEPEVRRRIAKQTDHTHDMVQRRIAIHGRENTKRNTKRGADDDSHGRQFDGGWEDACNIFQYRTTGSQRVAKIEHKRILEV